MDNPFQTRRAKVAALAAAVLVVGALLYAVRSGFVPRVSNADEGEFLLVDASDRELDGSPALALTFTLPLDARKSYDKSIRVFEMPSPPAAPVRWPPPMPVAPLAGRPITRAGSGAPRECGSSPIATPRDIGGR